MLAFNLLSHLICSNSKRLSGPGIISDGLKQLGPVKYNLKTLWNPKTHEFRVLPMYYPMHHHYVFVVDKLLLLR